MKICPTCNTELDDDAVFCHNCGAKQTAGQPDQPWDTPFESASQEQQPRWQPARDQWDHTEEFEQQDVKDHRLLAMTVYLAGVVGILLSLLGGKESAYLQFHIRQGLKFLIVTILLGAVTVVLAWTIVVPLLTGAAVLVLLVLRVICFVWVCQGKSKEPWLLRSLGFLK